MRIRLLTCLIAFFAINVLGITPANAPNSISASTRALVSAAPPLEVVDKDTLEIAGDWKLTYGFGTGFPLISPRTQPVHFDVTGPGHHGGVRFKGQYTDGHPGTFEGETFYNGRGVQIVQMMLYCDPLRYLEVLCGKHVKDSSKVWVMGAWANVGNSANGDPKGGSGYLANFEMVKVIKSPIKIKPQ